VNASEASSQRAQAQSRAARESIKLNQRFAYSPKEFGEANGKSATWGYRQIYAGKVKVISDCGRLLIPHSEIERFLARAAEYNPQAKSTGNAKENGGEAWPGWSGI
jgi:hypothetical protein